MKWHISRNVSHAHLLTQWPNINTGEKRRKENKIKRERKRERDYFSRHEWEWKRDGDETQEEAEWANETGGWRQRAL